MNLKNSIYLLALFLISCTEVIDISTNAAEPQLVVEATITNNQPAFVILTKSIALDDENEFEKVRNAQIRISDNTGNTELLTERYPGEYFSTILKGEIGKTYTLRIESNGQIVTATSTMPNQIPIDSFSVVNTLFPGGPQVIGNQPAPFYEINLKYTDPIGEQNFYRAVLMYNGRMQSRNSIFSDRFTNGKQMESRLILFNDSVKNGDKIQVDFLCIDKDVFGYFESMGNSAMGPGNSSSPANPYTNLNGAILGYFSAQTSERREWVIQK